MKKLIQLSFLLLFAFTVQAQTTTAETTKPVAKKQVQNPAAYACPKCYQISKGEGKCATCNTDKIQLGTYYCAQCLKSTGNKPGTCPTCKSATVQMTRKYCAKMGGTPLKNTPAVKPVSKS